MKEITINLLTNVMFNKSYAFYQQDNINYNLNLIGIRAINPIVNKFNDLLIVCWKYNGVWKIKKYNITTLPGKYYMENPINDKGCAILVPGQYRGMWSIGKHFDQTALVQTNNCRVYRDNNKDNILNFNDEKIEEGIFGIDCHRKNQIGIASDVDQGSAGCQVHQNHDEFDNDFMPLMMAARMAWSNSFTYTLLDEKDL